MEVYVIKKIRRILTCFVLAGVTIYALRYDVKYLYCLYEKWDDRPSALSLSSYRVEIDGRPVEGVDGNLSGLTWSGYHGLLFAVISHPPELIWTDTMGRLAGRISLPLIPDPESVVWQEDNIFWIGSEKEGAVYQVAADIEVPSVEIRERLTIPGYSAPRNKGLEGLAWDARSQRLYVAKEKKPRRISVVDRRDENRIFTQDTQATANLSDISGLAFHSGSDSLIVLSDASGKVLEVDSDGVTRDRLFLMGGWSELKNDIPQPEGVTFDAHDNLYIVSEPNLFYRFGRQSSRENNAVAGQK